MGQARLWRMLVINIEKQYLIDCISKNVEKTLICLAIYIFILIKMYWYGAENCIVPSSYMSVFLCDGFVVFYIAILTDC